MSARDLPTPFFGEAGKGGIFFDGLPLANAMPSRAKITGVNQNLSADSVFRFSLWK